MRLDGNSKELRDYAKWQYNSFFLESIIMSLDYMINEGHGYPQGLTPKKWKGILTEMETGFKLAQKKVEHEKVSKKEELKINKSFDLFKHRNSTSL